MLLIRYFKQNNVKNIDKNQFLQLMKIILIPFKINELTKITFKLRDEMHILTNFLKEEI